MVQRRTDYLAGHRRKPSCTVSDVVDGSTNGEQSKAFSQVEHGSAVNPNWGNHRGYLPAESRDYCYPKAECFCSFLVTIGILSSIVLAGHACLREPPISWGEFNLDRVETRHKG